MHVCERVCVCVRARARACVCLSVHVCLRELVCIACVHAYVVGVRTVALYVPIGEDACGGVCVCLDGVCACAGARV